MEADPLAPWLLAVKLALYTSALLAAGLGLHASLGVVEREDHARTLRLAALLASAAIVFAALRLAVANVQLGGSIESVFDKAILAWTWPNLAPSSIAIIAGALGMVGASVWRLVWLAAPAAVALAAGFALTGHSQALDTPGLAPWAVALHVLIAAFWIAAPISLWPRGALSNEALETRAQRFTRCALLAVPLLFIAGGWLALRLAGSAEALVSSTYGQLLLVKLAAATAALALGGYNKQVVTRKLRETPDQGRQALSVTLSLDGLFFASALVLVGIATTFTGPPTG